MVRTDVGIHFHQLSKSRCSTCSQSGRLCGSGRWGASKHARKDRGYHVNPLLSEVDAYEVVEAGDSADLEQGVSSCLSLGGGRCWFNKGGLL